ncbi:hypothetical protein BDF22DRAFT_181495 [Syncephalis plumigaleata]|nr:hypothetical protein BDF22DRAFT_181495 [Syncephalis plumigaleata]
MSLNRVGTVRGVPPASLGGASSSSAAVAAASGSGNLLHLTPEEAHIYAQLFNYADNEREGVLRGQKAVTFFQKSKLPASVLGEIWQIADYEDRGALTQGQFNIALKLIALAQDGRAATVANLNSEASLPIFGDLYLEPYDPSDPKRNLLNVTTPLPPSALSAGPSGASTAMGSMAGPVMPSPSLRATTASPLPVSNDPIGPEARSKFARMFASCQPVNGELDGERAKAIFMKSKLPMEKLGQIWTLADTQNRGRLDVHEFTIAMYLIQHTMDGSLKQLPAHLPNGFYPSTSTPASSSIAGSPVIHAPPSGTVPRYHAPADRAIPSGSMTMSRILSNRSNDARNSMFPSENSSPMSTAPWDVTSEQQATFGRYFDGLDQGQRGFIGGDEAVRFFLNSKLPESVLAHIWDLADINKSGRLTRDEFAVAMHLIHRQLRGQPLPSALPNSLIPPAMRTTTSTPVLGPFDPNLFSGNNGSATMPVRRGSNIMMPAADPFSTNDSPFGMGTVRRGSVPAAPKPNYPEALMDLFATPIEPITVGQVKSPAESTGDLFDINGEDIPADNSVVTQSAATAPDTSSTNTEEDGKFADIRRLQREIAEQQRENELIKQQRATEEADAQRIATERRDLSVQLAQLKSIYASESKQLADIRATYETEKQQLDQDRTDVMNTEHELLLVRKEKTDLESQLLRDREENASLQKRLRDANEELERLRLNMVGLKKDARLASALLDANKQSLDKAETEKYELQEGGNGGGLKVSSPTHSAISAPSFDDPFAGFEDSFKASPRALSDSAKDEGQETTSSGINAFDLAAAFGDPVEVAVNVPLPTSQKGSTTTPFTPATSSVAANLFATSSSAVSPPHSSSSQHGSSTMLRTETLPSDFDALFADMDQPTATTATSNTSTTSSRAAASRKPFDFDTAFKNADFGFDTFAATPSSTAASTPAKLAGRRPAPSPPTSRRSIASASLPGSDILDRNDKDNEWPTTTTNTMVTDPTLKRTGSVTLEDSDNDFESRFPALPGGLSSTLPQDSSVLLESTPQSQTSQSHTKEDVDKAFDLPVKKEDVPLGFEDAFGDIKS